jgi:hypothetical protein
VPGISSEEDVMRILGQLEAEGRIASYTKLSDTHCLAQFPSGGSLGVALIDGYVRNLTVGYEAFDYRVRQVIERFGEPEAYGPYSNFNRSDCSCENWDDSVVYSAPSTGGYLVYPSQGVTVRVRIPGGYIGCICPEMKAGVLYYYQPRSLAYALQEGRTPAFGGIDWSSEDLVQWHGYGPGY